MGNLRAPTSTYHFVMTYLNREQIERVLKHYEDYIVSALYILHDKDRYVGDDKDECKIKELSSDHNKLLLELNVLKLSVSNAESILKSRQFATDEERNAFKRAEISIKKRAITRLQNKITKINDQLRLLGEEAAKIGSIKEPHYHVLIKTYGAHTAEAVRRWFYRFRVTQENEVDGVKQEVLVNTLNSIADNVGSCRDYLTHKNEPESEYVHIYDTKEVLTFGLGWQSFNKHNRSADDCLTILDRITNGDSRRQLARDYGREIILHYDKYQRYALAMESEEIHAHEVKNNEYRLIRELKEKNDPDTNWDTVLDTINRASYIVEMFNKIVKEVSSNC